jgi:hypothetical protein
MEISRDGDSHFSLLHSRASVAKVQSGLIKRTRKSFVYELLPNISAADVVCINKESSWLHKKHLFRRADGMSELE